jgi:hypothetical protein
MVEQQHKFLLETVNGFLEMTPLKDSEFLPKTAYGTTEPRSNKVFKWFLCSGDKSRIESTKSSASEMDIVGKVL